jgi:hypothetical protein
MLQSNSPVLTGVVGRFSCSRHFSLTRIGSPLPSGGQLRHWQVAFPITASMFISDHWRGALSNAEERDNQNLQPTRLRHECSADDLEGLLPSHGQTGRYRIMEE